MTRFSPLCNLCLTASFGLLASPVTQADAAIMLDFGPTVASGASLTNSPLHTADPLFTEATWNTVGTADPGALLNSNNTTATGVTANVGTATSGATINLGTQPGSSNALGTATSTGVYAGTSVGTDGIFQGAANTATRVGVQVTGLAAGIYDVYLTGRNTNTGTGQNHSVTLLAGGGSAGDFDSGTLGSVTLSYADPNVATASWVEGGNYARFTVTLSAGQALNFAAAAPGNNRGFLNSAQIVLVPEPASLLLAGLGSLLVVSRRRRD